MFKGTEEAGDGSLPGMPASLAHQPCIRKNAAYKSADWSWDKETF